MLRRENEQDFIVAGYRFLEESVSQCSGDICHSVGRGGNYGDETEWGHESTQHHEVERTSDAARRFLYPGLPF